MIQSKLVEQLSIMGALLIIAFLAGCGSVSGGADLTTLAKPEMTTAQGNVTFVIPCDAYGYDFDVRLDVAYDLKFILFFDRQGDPSALHVQVSNRETFTNTKTGLSVTATDAGVDIVDLESGTISIIGVLARITLPGKGVLVLDVGKITFDADDNLLFVAGPHQTFFGGDGLICAALA